MPHTVREPAPRDDSAHEQRADVRVAESAVVRLRRADGRTIEAGVHDLSAGGVLVETDTPLRPGERVALPLFELPRDIEAIVQPARAEMTPLVFVDLTPTEGLLIVKHVAAKVDEQTS